MSDTQVTSVCIKGAGAWPFTEISSVIHRCDFTDLGEPYLSAVAAKRLGWNVPNRLHGAEVNREGDAV